MDLKLLMRPLNLPKAQLKLIKKMGEVYVWDIFRKKQLLLTPEEWVRQHILHTLVNHNNYPVHLIVSEQGISVNGLTRRCDAVVYKNGVPVMIVECKAPHIVIDEKVVHQIAQYNFKLTVNFLLLTNGLRTIILFINRKENKIEFLESIPSFDEL